ncbi:MAG: sulfate permease [gamma proteobacterium symbiont of Bathyaustriella thionipta]|nr:sulfate permease [gamma proteobacterium symbiont of Bathyaustriella thionipta]MCU7950105.1 sulfate permease [gamma proteobacterium symbiont of Bathyaustriella thionipta]MCU7953480.1 sulfate permease [gamma proteobacterium symbiont of Bathyaustriella thionipta]MCU7955571.1 sulfate permease [gamma proteobacterium symbiont of Bathyaustriella thionipta]MCU7967639.1 sulfate permease [gamma proteobacterium symbiont of Bathyaustriella thionipta]
MNSIRRFLPFLRWFPMDGNTVKADVIAGITVALVLIPQSMAYASLAGLPAYFGLYAAFLPVMVAALWGSSSQLGTGPVAVVSLLTASAVTPLAPVGSPEFVSLAIMLAFMVGVFQFMLGVFKLGVIVNFLSHPVIVGFTNAAAMVIALSQLNKIFGVEKQRSEFFLGDIWGVMQNLGDTHIATLIFGLVSVIGIMYAKKKCPKLPGVLIAVAGTTIVSWAIDFESMGGAVVGTIPEGLPSLAMPAFNMDVFGTLVSSAIVISLIGFMEAISIAKAMAAKTKERIDPSQELMGQGLGNMLGAMSSAYPTSGSFSRSAVNINAGALTGMSSVYTGIIVLITLLFLTPLLYHLPKAVLAAVIMTAVFGLINFKAVKHAWHASRHDGIASIVTFIATLGFAPHLDKGIEIGAGLAILLYLYRTMSPRVAILGRYKDGTLRDVKVNDLDTSDQIIAIRFDGSLYFANISYFEDAILEAVSDKPDAEFILVVGDAINQLDASGEEVLQHLNERLKENNIQIVFSGLKRQVLMVMRKTGLFDEIGHENIFANEDMALEAIYKRLGDTSEFDSANCPLTYPRAVQEST